MKHPDLLEPLGSLAGADAVRIARDTGLGLVIDNFAGGGGASTGIEAALGRAIDVAINHDAEAVAMHRANHPGTRHYCQSVWAADPQQVVDQCGGGPIALAWFSPDCKHFSKAKGGKPVEKNIRDLAWVVVLWAQRVRPRVIMLENVEEFRTWGPLTGEGRPCPENRGLEYRRWTKELRKAGYKVEDRELKACDYGAPTSRKRLFIIARCDGEPIAWPAPTHGKPGSPEVLSGARLPWRTAAEIIDWSIPCPSIFERRKELKDATKRRIAHGIMRFVVNSPNPFIVPICHTQGGNRATSGDQPVPTVTTAKGGEFALVAPVFARTAHGERDSKGKKRGKGDHGPEETFPTVLASQDSALITALITPFYGEKAGGQVRSCNSAEDPLRTQGCDPTFGLVSACLSKLASGNAATGALEPTQTIEGKAKHSLLAVTLVSVDNTSTRAIRAFDAEDPLRTITSSGGGFAYVSATLIQTSYGEREGQAPRVLDLAMPLGTIVAGGIKHSIATVVLVPHVMTMRNAGSPSASADQPARTTTAGGAHQNLVSAFLHKYRPDHPGQSLDDPAPTVTANSYVKRPGGAPPLAVVCAPMEQANTGMVGHPMTDPVSTIVQKGCTQRFIASSLVKLRGTSRHGQPVDEPLHTISAGGGKGGIHFAEVAAFLVKYYGAHQHGQAADQPLDSVTSKARFGLVTVTIDGEEYVIADIGMRMLTPRELARAQGFPDSYILDPPVNGKPMTKTAQIRMIGNSVCPPLSEALVRANLLDEAAPAEAVAA